MSKIMIQSLKLYWTKSEGDNESSFDGIPFSVDKMRILDCHYGELAILEEKSKQKKTLKLQGSRQIGCPAKIHVLTHTHFTQKFKSC